LLSFIKAFFSSIIKFYSGLITDKINKYKPILIFAYAITPISSGLIGTSKYVWQILIYKSLGWMSKGLREPMRDKWITQIISSKHYGKAFGFVRALDTVGAIIGPLIAYFSLKIFTLNHVFFIAFIPGFFSVLSLFFLTHENKIHEKVSYCFNWKRQLKELPQKFRYFVIIMFIFGIGNFNKMLIIFRAQEILSGKTNSYLVATGWAILLYTFFNIIRAISEYAIGTLSDYINRKNLLAILGFGLFGISSLLQIIPTYAITLWLFIFLFAGISTGTVKALEKAYSASLLTENVRGTGFGILQMADGIGDLISSLVVGTLWTAVSPASGFLYAVLLSAISMVLLLLFKE